MRTHVAAQHVATVPPQKLARRLGGGTRVEERAREPFYVAGGR